MQNQREMLFLVQPRYEPKTPEAKLADDIYIELNKLADELPYNEKIAIRMQVVAFPQMIKGLDVDEGFRVFFRKLAGVFHEKLEAYIADKDK